MDKKFILKLSVPIAFVIIGIAAIIIAIPFVVKSNKQEGETPSKPITAIQNVDSLNGSNEDFSSEQQTATSSREKTTSNSKENITQSDNNSVTVENKDSETKNQNTSSSDIDKVVEVYKFNDEFVIPNAEAFTYRDNKSDITLPYRMFLPKNYTSSKKYPVLLFLHGLGENGKDNQSQLNNFQQAFTVAGDILSKAIVVCPQSLDGWDYYGYEMGDLAAVKRLLDSIIDEYNGDRQRIYITGLSMGGYGTWKMLEQYGHYFAAGVPICGWGNSAAAPQFAEIPIWVFHGTDDPTVNIMTSEEMVRAITDCGGAMIEFTKLPGVAHNAWDYAYTNREMFCWMFSQNLKTHQSYSYDYFEYFKVTDPAGKVLFTEEDIEFVSQSFSGGSQYIEAKLNGSTFKILQKAYRENKDKIFTVYYCSEKLYSFKFLSEPVDESFYIRQVVSDEDFEKMIINFERINAKS